MSPDRDPQRVEERSRFAEYALTVGSLGSSTGQTVMVALLPLLLARYAPSAIWIGFAIGLEGLLAMGVPYWIGTLSDALPERVARRLGRRNFFLLATAPLMAGILVVTPFLTGYWPLALVALAFFAALHGYLTPLWALMIDLVPDRRRARVQGVRGAFQAGGLAIGMVAGGALFDAWEALPFFVAAALVLVTTAVTVAVALPKRTARRAAITPPISSGGPGWLELLQPAPIRWFLLANVLWTGAVDGIRPYIFLFAGVVVGISVAEASGVLLFLVVGLAAGAVILGRLGDRYSRSGLLQVGLIVTGVAMLGGTLIRDVTGIALVLPFAGLGAAVLVALPFPIFASLVRDQFIGRYTGLYILSLGVGRIIAPVLVGAAIDLARPVFPELEGYPAMWPVAGALALLSWWALRKACAPGPGAEAR